MEVGPDHPTVEVRKTHEDKGGRRDQRIPRSEETGTLRLRGGWSIRRSKIPSFGAPLTTRVRDGAGQGSSSGPDPGLVVEGGEGPRLWSCRGGVRQFTPILGDNRTAPGRGFEERPGGP